MIRSTDSAALFVCKVAKTKWPVSAAVIASEIGGVTDLVRPGENGFLFPPGDENALRKIMQDAIDQPGLIERLRPRTELPTIEAYAQTIIDRAAGIRERELTNTANDMISQADDGLQQLVARI